MTRTQVNVKMRTEIKEMLRELSAADLRSMSSMVEFLIHQEHARRQQQGVLTVRASGEGDRSSGQDAL